MSIRKPAIGQKRLMPLVPHIRSIDEGKRTIEFVASTESEDRHGDIIRVAGWKLDNYMRNPVFLWAHRSTDPPIGKTVELHIEVEPAALVHKVEFADRETYPFADTVYRLYKGNFLNAVSVGFMPTEAPKRRFGEEEEFLGYEFTGQELLELSGTPVPAQQDALARACRKGVITEGDASLVTKCGEDNAPWAYLIPGVTYPADEESPKRSRSTMVVPEMPAEKTEELTAPPEPEIEEIIEPDPMGDIPDTGEEIFRVTPDGAVTGPESATFNTDGQANADFPAQVTSDEDDPLDFHPNNTMHAVLETRQCQKRIARALRWMDSVDHWKAETDQRLHALQDTANDIYKCLVLGPEPLPTESRTVVPYKKEKLAERDYAWDASKEMAKTSSPVGWKRMSTVIVGDAENKTSYKLPHHRGNDYATVFRGVTAALGRFEQTEMPSEDRAPARKHLLRHRAEFQEAGFDIDQTAQKMETLGTAYRNLKELSYVDAAAYFDVALWRLAAENDGFQRDGDRLLLDIVGSKTDGLGEPISIYAILRNGQIELGDGPMPGSQSEQPASELQRLLSECMGAKVL